MTNSSQENGRYRILLIEDDAEAAADSSNALREHGDEVFVSNSGKEGIKKVEEIDPEIVICT